MYKNLFCSLAMILITFNACASAGKPDYYAVHGSMSLYAMKEGGKYKLYDNSEKKTISHAYDSIYGCYAYSECTNQVVVVSSGGKFGLIDAVTGKEILRPADSPITDFRDGIYTPDPLVWNIDGKRQTLTSTPVYVDAHWGYNAALNPVIYYYTWDLQTYDLGTPRYGFCDREGREVIPPLYDQAGSFIDSIAVVAIKGRYGVINTAGQQVLPLEYDMIEYSSQEGFLKVSQKEDDSHSLNGIADRTGKMLIPCQYDKIELFYHKSLDNTDYIKQFSVGKRTADGTLLYGIMDRNGKEIFPVKYAGINGDAFGRYILYASHDRAGMADNNGTIIIPMIYTRVSSDIDPGYILVWKGDKCGLVTPDNEVLVRPDKFDAINLIHLHRKTFFYAMQAGKWGRIDRTGKILLAPKYEQIEPYRERDDESQMVLLDGRWMRIDSRGNVLERYEKYPYEPPKILTLPSVEYPSQPKTNEK